MSDIRPDEEFEAALKNKFPKEAQTPEEEYLNDEYNNKTELYDLGFSDGHEAFMTATPADLKEWQMPLKQYYEDALFDYMLRRNISVEDRDYYIEGFADGWDMAEQGQTFSSIKLDVKPEFVVEVKNPESPYYLIYKDGLDEGIEFVNPFLQSQLSQDEYSLIIKKAEINLRLEYLPFFETQEEKFAFAVGFREALQRLNEI